MHLLPTSLLTQGFLLIEELVDEGESVAFCIKCNNSNHFIILAYTRIGSSDSPLYPSTLANAYITQCNESFIGSIVDTPTTPSVPLLPIAHSSIPVTNVMFPTSAYCQSDYCAKSKSNAKDKAVYQMTLQLCNSQHRVSPTLPLVSSFSKKYKPVGIKVKPVITVLPDQYCIVHNITGNLLANIPMLLPRPPEFVPYRQDIEEHKQEVNKLHSSNFLLPEEQKLLHHFIATFQDSFAWNDVERGDALWVSAIVNADANSHTRVSKFKGSIAIGRWCRVSDGLTTSDLQY